jgi:menaquinone-specific isochorismate synthase
LVIEADGDDVSVQVIDGDISPDEALALVSDYSESEPPDDFSVASVHPPQYWRDEIVAKAIATIHAGRLDKVVLARELEITANREFSPGEVLNRLHARYDTAIRFRVEGFLGASPELLVKRNQDVVSAHPLAGTAPRFGDTAKDAASARELEASTKNQWEHRITINWLLDNLLPFCSYVDADPEPQIVTLANVHHLGTRVEGRLSRPSAHILELVAALHPTPAVGGAPQDEAIKLIAELEQAERGRYAGPVGWLDSNGNGAFAVAIRSAEIEANKARLFAGVGVVGDSEPESELAETESKFQTMRQALAPGSP